MKKGIIINLWFNNNAQEAVDFYTSVFKKSQKKGTDYYTDVKEEVTGHKKGDIVTIEFEILGTKFVAINAGPEFPFNPSFSLMVPCQNQGEIDYYWEKLSANPAAEQCGWLQDKFGISWQIVPRQLEKLLKKGTEAQKKRVTEAFMAMKKMNIAGLERAFRESSPAQAN